MVKANHLVAVLAMLAVSGCDTVLQPAGGAKIKNEQGPIDRASSNGYGRYLPPKCTIEKGMKELDPKDEKSQQSCRAALVGAWVAESNKLCNEYLQTLTQDTTGWNLLLGGAGSLFGGLANVFAKTQTVKPLSGIGAAFTGIKTEYDSDVLAKQTIGAIVQAIQAQREADLQVITNNLGSVPQDTTKGKVANKPEGGIAPQGGNAQSNENPAPTPNAPPGGSAPGVPQPNVAGAQADKKPQDSGDSQTADGYVPTSMVRYPILMAAAQVEKYHQDCSLSAGLAQLNQTAANQKSDVHDNQNKTTSTPADTGDNAKTDAAKEKAKSDVADLKTEIGKTKQLIAQVQANKTSTDLKKQLDTLTAKMATPPKDQATADGLALQTEIGKTKKMMTTVQADKLSADLKKQFDSLSAKMDAVEQSSEAATISTTTNTSVPAAPIRGRGVPSASSGIITQ